MGLAACLSDLYDRHGSRKKLKKKNQLQTMEIKVKMDCEGCERRVRKSVEGMKGVSSVDVDPKKSKLTVVGYVDPDKVLNRVRHRTGKKADMWPYVPYNVVDHPYDPVVYDKKAPPGFVKNTERQETMEIKVKMDCEGCERRVRKSVEGMKGVSSVDVDPKKSKLTVVGYVDPDKVLNRVRHRTGKKADMWPYVPYNVVDHPYDPVVYDKKAPPGFVKNTEVLDPQTAGLARASSTEIRYTTAFSDENATACVVM